MDPIKIYIVEVKQHSFYEFYFFLVFRVQVFYLFRVNISLLNKSPISVIIISIYFVLMLTSLLLINPFSFVIIPEIYIHKTTNYLYFSIGISIFYIQNYFFFSLIFITYQNPFHHYRTTHY